MYPVQNRLRGSYWKGISAISRLEERIPTLAGTLDSYFDENIEAIIEEWQLLTDYELKDLGKKLERVTEEINNLQTEKKTVEARAASLEAELTKLEG